MTKSRPKKMKSTRARESDAGGDEPAKRGRRFSPLTRWVIVIGGVAIAWLVGGLLLDIVVQRSLGRRELTKAIWWARPAAWLQPWDTDLPLVRAKAARLAGDLDSWSAQMQPLAAKAKNSATTHELLFGKIQLGDFPDTYHSLMGKMLEVAPGGEVAEAFVLGFLAKHDRENARAILDAWKRDEPQNPQVEYVEAVFEEIIGNRREAITRLSSFSTAHPAHQSARVRLADIHLADRRYEAALEELSALSTQGDDSPSTTMKLARCLRLLGKVDEAKSHLTKLLATPLSTESDSDLAQRELAQRELAQCQLELGEYADAAKTLRAAGVHHLESQEQSDLALADYLSGNKETAEKVYSSIDKARQIQSRRADLEVYLLLNPQDEKARRELAILNGGP